MRVQAFVVEIDGLTVLVDPCVGNGKVRWLPVWNELDLPFLERLADAGFTPAGGRARAAHPPARRPRRLGHPPRRRRLGADVHRGPPPLHRGRARLRPHLGPARRRRLRRLDRARSSRPASPTWSSPTPTSGTGCASSRRPATRPGTPRCGSSRTASTRSITGDFMHHPLQFAEPQLAEIADADVERRPCDPAPHARARWRAPARRARHALPEPPGRTRRRRRRRLAVRRPSSRPPRAASRQSIRCISTTSSQRPNLRPTSRSQPISSKPHLRCSAIDAS